METEFERDRPSYRCPRLAARRRLFTRMPSRVPSERVDGGGTADAERETGGEGASNASARGARVVEGAAAAAVAERGAGDGDGVAAAVGGGSVERAASASLASSRSAAASSFTGDPSARRCCKLLSSGEYAHQGDVAVDGGPHLSKWCSHRRAWRRRRRPSAKAAPTATAAAAAPTPTPTPTATAVARTSSASSFTHRIMRSLDGPKLDLAGHDLLVGAAQLSGCIFQAIVETRKPTCICWCDLAAVL